MPSVQSWMALMMPGHQDMGEITRSRKPGGQAIQDEQLFIEKFLASFGDVALHSMFS